MSVKKAQDAMLANVGPGHNQPPPDAREGFFEQCKIFGTNAGAGDTSKVGWFQALTEAAWQGVIIPGSRRKKGDTTSPPSDAEMAYDTFADARKAKAGEMGKRIAGKDGKDHKQRVSEANRMIILGALPLIHEMGGGGMGVFARTLKIIRETEDLGGPVDDMLLEVARKQTHKDHHSVPLTDDQIKQTLAPDPEQEKKPKQEVELWGLVLRQIESIMNTKYPDTAGTDPMAKQARNSVLNRYETLGGKPATVNARAKAAAPDPTPEQSTHAVQRQGARGAKAAAKNKKKR